MALYEAVREQWFDPTCSIGVTDEAACVATVCGRTTPSCADKDRGCFRKDDGVVSNVLDCAAIEPPNVAFSLEIESVVDEEVSQRASIEVADMADGTHHVPAGTL